MFKIRLNLLISGAALCMAIAFSANATTTSLTSGPFSAEAVSSESFDSGNLPSNYTASGPNAGVIPATIVNHAAAPTGDSTPFAYAGPESSIHASFTSGINYLGFFWGSPDDYNTLTFVDANGISTVYGEGGTPIAGMINDHQSGVYVNFYNSGAAWVSATWTSSSPAFEFDNVAYGNLAATPEPASIALLAGGLLAIGAGRLRRALSAS